MCGLVRLRCVVFGRTADDDSYHQTDYNRDGQVYPVVDAQQPHDQECGKNNQHRTQVCSERQGFEQVFHACVFPCAHGKYAEYGEQDAHRGNQHRCDDGLELHFRIAGSDECGCSQSRCGKNRTAVGFIQVGSHSGHVAHIVTHIVGNRCRIPRIVFRNPCLHFSHQVGSYIGCFGIDASAYTGKECLRGGSHSESKHGGGDDAKFGCRIHHVFRYAVLQQQIPERDVEQAKSYNDQPHYCPAPESDPQAFVERVARGVGCPRRSVCGGLHAEIARKSGKESAGQKRYRNPVVLQVESVCHDGKEDDQADENHGHHFILLFQIRHGTRPHVQGDAFHCRSAFAFGFHLPVEVPGKQECQRG